MSVKNISKVAGQRKQRLCSSQSPSLPLELLKIRSRIHKIIDEQLALISQEVRTQEAINKLHKLNAVIRNFIVNESKLQDWVGMFRHEILIVQERKVEIDLRQQEERVQNQIKTPFQLTQINYLRPLIPAPKARRQILWSIDQNKMNVFQFKQINRKDTYISSWQSTTYELPSHTIKPFSSITYCHQLDSMIIIGGSKPTNPNIKSSKIYQLNLRTTQISHIASLPYGLSSHTAVYNPTLLQIYIIGGNKNYSIVTRGCFKLKLSLKLQQNPMKLELNQLKLEERIVEEISCLNYPAASSSCVLWRDRWLYKFGGVGESFGGWDVSPYIERYSILQNEWEVVNPVLPHQGNPALSFSSILHSNSSSYVSEDENKIFVFGGFSIDGKFKNQAFILELNQNENDNQIDDITAQNHIQHVIREYGFLDCHQDILKGFAFCETMQKEIQMYGLKSINHKQSLLFPSLIHTFPKTL